MTEGTPPVEQGSAERDGLAVSARDVTKRYGAGGAAVDALRGVSVDFPKGQFAAVMGPSGSGKSTLMNILAGLDAPTSGSVVIDGTEITTLKDKPLTLLRREKVGFVFQFFNLLPMLTAEENLELPMAIAGRKIDRSGSSRSSPPWASTTGASTAPPSSRAASSSASPWPAASSRARPCSSPTSRPATSTPRPSDEMLTLLRRSVDEYGQTIVMVTHEARAAATADRVLFLRDGADRRGPRPPRGRRDLRRRQVAGAGVTRLVLRGLIARKLRTILTSIAIVLGVAMVAGTFILTDQINAAFDDIFETGNSKIDVVVSRATEFDTFEDALPPLPESTVAEVARVDGVEHAEGQIQASGQLVVDGEIVESEGGAPALVVSNVDESINPNVPLEGRLPENPGEIAVIKDTADKEDLKVGQGGIALATQAGTQPVSLVGVFRYGDVESIGGATVVADDLRRRPALVRPRGRDLAGVRVGAGRRVGRAARATGCAVPSRTP